MWWGAAAGVLFGLVAGLLKIIIGQAQGGLTAVLGQGPVWALLVTGACAVVLDRRAHRVTKVSVSMPVLNLVDVLVALVFATHGLRHHGVRRTGCSPPPDGDRPTGRHYRHRHRDFAARTPPRTRRGLEPPQSPTPP
jgi:hypothetical protein